MFCRFWRWGFTGLSAHRLVVITLFHFEIASCQRMRYISRRSSTEVNQLRIHSPLSSRGTPWPLYLSVLLTLCHFSDKSSLVFLPIAISLLRCSSFGSRTLPTQAVHLPVRRRYHEHVGCSLKLASARKNTLFLQLETEHFLSS